MRRSVTYSTDDVKKLLAEKHGVEVKDVIKSQYSYTVLLKDEPSADKK